MSTEFRRMDILKLLYDAMEDVPRSKKVFVTDRPKASVKQLIDFVVVSLTGSMEDLNAYGEAYARIDVFAYDKNGLEDSERLDDMQQAVLSKFPMSNRLFTTYKPKLVAGGSDGFGFHYLTIQFKIIFK